MSASVLMNASAACYAPEPTSNHILDALPIATRARCAPALEVVDMQVGQELAGTELASPYVIFPTTAIFSLVCMTSQGGSAEVSVVGNEGVLGVSFSLGSSGTPGRPRVQTAGRVYRLPGRYFAAEISRSSQLLALVIEYTGSIMNQVAQTVLCNRYHSIEQQLSRRLLLGLDRSTTNNLLMTHEGLANLLGVRREGITTAALKLRRAGIIRYNRGQIVVLNREGLERQACECYAVDKDRYARLLPTHISSQGRPAARFNKGVRRRLGSGEFQESIS